MIRHTITILFLIVLSSCARTDHPAFQQQVDQSADLAIYRDFCDSLLAGQVLLQHVLPHEDIYPRIFKLSSSGARIINETLARSLDHNDLLSTQYATFFQSSSKTYYYNPQSLCLEQLTNNMLYTIYRSVGFARKPTWTQNQLDIVAFTFQLQEKDDLHINIDEEEIEVGTNVDLARATPLTTEIAFHSQQRISNEAGNNRMPLYFPLHKKLIYLNHIEKKDGSIQQSLRMRDLSPMNLDPLDENNTISTSLISNPFPQLTGNCRGLVPYDHNRFVIAIQRNGIYRPFILDLRDGTYTAHNGEAGPALGSTQNLINMLVQDGALQSTVLTLPQEYDLNTLLALVSAQNTSINRYRALLAASMFEARQLSLATAPQLNYSFSQTPLSNIITNGGTSFSGDYLATGLSRGLFGIVQDLFAIPQKLALAESGRVRSQIAQDLLQEEIVRQQTETCALYLEALSLRDQDQVDQALVDLLSERLENMRQHQKIGLVLESETQAAEHALSEATEGQITHQQAAAGIHADILRNCGLAQDSVLTLKHVDYQLAQLAPQLDLASLQRLARLNQPRLAAARKLLSQAFFNKKADKRFRAQMNAGVQYGVTADSTAQPIDDYISLSLSGRVSLAQKRGRTQNKNYWDSIQTSLKLSEQEAMLSIDSAVAQQWKELQYSMRLWQQERRKMQHSLERLRIARLYENHPLVETNFRQHSHGVSGEQEVLFQNLRQQIIHSRQIGQQLAKLWRHIGSAQGMREQLNTVNKNEHQHTSIWIRRSHDLLSNKNARRKIIAFAQKHMISRIHISLIMQKSTILSTELMRERLTRFIRNCGKENISVWGVIPEPQWKTESNYISHENRMRTITQYQNNFGPFEPGLAGLTINIAIPDNPQWHTEKNMRETQHADLLILINKTRRQLPANMSLWCDLPQTYFQASYRTLARELALSCDGLSIMSNHNSRKNNTNVEGIQRIAHELSQSWKLPIDIGIKLTPNNSAAISLNACSSDKTLHIKEDLLLELSQLPFFRHIVTHNIPNQQNASTP